MPFTEGFRWDLWSLLGLLGQGIFGSRFYVQWIASERRGASVVPEVFWWLSILGSVILTVYWVGRGDIVGVLPALPAIPIYLRNLQLLRRSKLQARVAAAAADTPTAAEFRDTNRLP
jgi:lipid-A-disaccharide synthase-like uncharacterized protein